MNITCETSERAEGITQVHIPAFMPDNDGVSVFVRVVEGARRVTDLGFTRMRLSATTEIDDEADALLAKVAGQFGVALDGGELVASSASVDEAVLQMVQAVAACETAFWLTTGHGR